ncbi:ATP-binding cassette domain-containing protein [Subtercola boreus]|uniref:ABC transporter domain-containing protein n=1 Tax=Subtercola boreus TaxID=120213 RepID=A0A3E0WGJ5_9MICO|nr:ATP-binding cassette domain-containing protein [Subtercola boreus]RFA23575.1 hypothetical protein B7R24_01465 [Subtercola boreus]RFA23969.1 hypothetical protein B7R23_01465 [Subtercola boreus]RFA29667.1 hypothetical protein B7R25_01460 [Subtercola boreus]
MPVHGLPLTLSSVSARSAAGTGIRSVSVEVSAGAVHGILGENLSGASEVLAVIGGYLPVDGGTLTVGGVEQHFAAHEAAEALGVRVVRGEPAIVPHLSVAENIYLGREGAVRGFIRFGRLNANAAELLTRFGLGAVTNPAAPASTLSRAERWIVELLRCLVAERTVVLLDEPFTGLDARGLDLVAAGIGRLAAEGVTVVVASHRIDTLRRVASEVTVMSRGLAVETVSTGSAPAARRLSATSRLIELMTANIVVTPRPTHESIAPGDVVLELVDFTAHHPVDTARAVVENVSLTARRGEIVGLAGLEGSGVSDLALSLFGRSFSSKVTGELRVNGHPLVASTPQESVAGGIGLSTAANLKYDLNLLGGIPSRISSSMLARFARLGLVDRDRDYKTAAPAFGLGGISALVGGGRRGSAGGGIDGSDFGGPGAGGTWTTDARRHLDALTAWLDLPLERRPVVVVLDHPTARLDTASLQVVRDLIVELAAGGTAVLFASDDLDELLVMTNRVYTFVAGRVTADLDTRAASPETLLAHMIGPA